jgi:hypothetical protein
MDRDSYYIPVGYDSSSILKNFDSQGHLEILYDERIQKISQKNIIKEEEVVCEDTNAFLGKILKTKPVAGSMTENEIKIIFKERDSNLKIPNNLEKSDSNTTTTSNTTIINGTGVDPSEYVSNKATLFDRFKNNPNKNSSADVSIKNKEPISGGISSRQISNYVFIEIYNIFIF